MSNLAQMLTDLDMENLLPAVRAAAEGGADPQDILKECQNGMIGVGDKFAAKEYFVSDLMMSAMLFKQIAEILDPYMKGDGAVSGGAVVLGTVLGDVHDIGKDIVASMLKANGFEVIDVGVDAPAEKFVNALKESGASVLALSCLLASCYDAIKDTIKAVEDAGLRESVKIIIGGGPIDDVVRVYTGADAFGNEPQAAVNFCKEVY